MTTPTRPPRQRGTAVHSRFDRTVTVYTEHGDQITETQVTDRTDLDDLDDVIGPAVRIGAWQPVAIGHVAAVELP